ncbi:MAG: tol-pal system protein YbgF [Candidatus Eisenbacteria bacterium]|uniref:Tol-pal system protein YbgF n=1 Tax=Eiseniibacteriota bacterium TaxID=2212470 RepID=A0A849SQY3_UNCEI|nr:tol-pal system protein YbgF [Candidatus Eisenbacteria bacterium]
MIPTAPVRFSPASARRRALAALVAVIATLGMLPGCYMPQLMRLQGGLDSLRAVVDTVTVRDSLTLATLRELRRELAEQRDILLSTRATAGNTTREMYDQMQRLQDKLDEVMTRFTQTSERAAARATPGTDVNPAQLFDQATQDLTQGRYGMALQGFREYVRKFATTELADNAQYGVGESFFALANFDSSAAEYSRVTSGWPQGDKVPAALYKLALSKEKLGDAAGARATFEDLLKRFPNSGEAQLARERVGGNRRR